MVKINVMFMSKREELVKMYHSGILKVWSNNVWSFELFLIFGALNGSLNYGTIDYYDELRTNRCSIRTFRQFLKNRSAAGDLILLENNKRPEKTIFLTKN